MQPFDPTPAFPEKRKGNEKSLTNKPRKKSARVSRKAESVPDRELIKRREYYATIRRELQEPSKVIKVYIGEE